MLFQKLLKTLLDIGIEKMSLYKMNKKLHRKTGWKKTFSVVKKKKKKEFLF